MKKKAQITRVGRGKYPRRRGVSRLIRLPVDVDLALRERGRREDRPMTRIIVRALRAELGMLTPEELAGRKAGA